MGLRRVIVPVSPGLFSAVGLLMADVQHDYSRTLLKTIHDIVDSEAAQVDRVFGELEQQARRDLASEGFAPEQVALDRSVAMHYLGQSYELLIAAPPGAVTPAALREVAETFCREHERVYGYQEGVSRVQLVAARLKARGLTPPSYADLGVKR
jgi:N-methylhydantoinase A